MKPRLLDMTVRQLREHLTQAGQPGFRADQIADWVYRKGVVEGASMSNVPPAVVETLDILTSRIVARAGSADGTIKLLLEFPDSQRIETVLIPESRRTTVCLSTQTGCGVGCSFCATARSGPGRNLRSGEILEQILQLRQVSHKRITNVVFMGMGEPLANYGATVSAVRAIIDPARFGISARNVVVSTVGLPKQIRRLAREDIPITLAVSIHAPTDELRRKLIPPADKYPLKEVISAARVFFQTRRREVTLEYVLIGGVNDSDACADDLAGLAKGLRCSVNLIAYNPVESRPYQPPSAGQVRHFYQRLKGAKINAQIRRPRGLDILAACGQLRRRTEELSQADQTPGDRPLKT